VIVLIDNYDSFTYNLYQYLAELGAEVRVLRNDQVTLEDVVEMEAEKLILSPGPCTPAEAGISVDLIDRMAGKMPILGVCLGHECIGEAFGATIGYAGEIMHGKSSRIEHDGKGVFRGLPQMFEAIRYHSLAIEPPSVPECLQVTATSESGVIMGVRHREYQVEGVQFHPESIATPVGKELLRNFLDMS
jgi:anthranilate synthase/aminodeoxychorismate synthase-like glutamine amidotransferase